ncbi:hypothetical protein [Aeromicrobium alkaliterrae]|uniref:Centromere-binding protein ParB C-terminal domain-containing protein n=1 Tax=Aeromicrobium alkaliterrae TaxID=302168 RepID=A0ABN2K9U7_9ACTN
MARRDFASMIPTLDKAPETPAAPPTPTVVPSTAAAATKKVDKSPKKTPEAKKAATRPPERSAPVASRGVAGGVGFDQLERKETRLSADQYAELTTIARDLNRRRAGAGHRITENTLIRLGIDLLRERAGDLSGATEAELRASLRLP